MDQYIRFGELFFHERVEVVKMLSHVLRGHIQEMVDMMAHIGVEREMVHICGSSDD